ncbi:hypothetical protein [Telluribacter sp. SYSU D00476]|uniref:hypothetical protein n=1 Tax=Telluribacter sp. SYSU D00476 TaxID=2811430 RepID=UPI001FF69445|nr:hypothetical protein [Telluribacter sp. SYSU D00476]
MNSKPKAILLSIALLFPVVVYLIYVIANAVPVFFADDFHLLKTIVWGQEAPSLSEKYMLLIQQHNEHRILIPRLLTWLDYLLEGSINWVSLIVFGNLLWIATLWFFWKAFKSLEVPYWLFIPLPWILFQPQYYDNVTWSISILQQSVIVFWFGLIAYLCAQNKYRWAVAVAVLATFTHGNGIFSFIVIGAMIVLERKWKEAAICLIVMVLVALHYFWDFGKGPNADFTRSLSNPVRLVASFFAFFGTMTKVMLTNPLYAAALGAVLFMIPALYLLPRLFPVFRKPLNLSFFDKILLGNLLFLAITGALVSVSRSWGGIETIIAPRYQHYSPYVCAWTYLVLIRLTAGYLRNAVGVVFLVGGILFNGLAYFVYTQEIKFRRDWLVADDTNWTNHKRFLQYNDFFNDNIRKEYGEAESRGICATRSHFNTLARYTMGNGVVPLEFSTNTFVMEAADWREEHQNLRIANTTVEADNIFLCFKAANHKEYWVPVQKHRNSVQSFLSTGSHYKPGFITDMLPENLAPGEYRLGVLVNNTFYWTDSRALIQENKSVSIKKGNN